MRSASESVSSSSKDIKKPTILLSFSSKVPGIAAIRIQEFIKKINKCNLKCADYMTLMEEIAGNLFIERYNNKEHRNEVFSHAKFKAWEVLNEINCLIIPGNNKMIDPSLFNETRNEADEYNFVRSVMELALIHVAIVKGIPIFGICGGHQLICVYKGGKVRELHAEEKENYYKDSWREIELSKSSMLYNPHDQNTQLVFAAHNQIVSDSGNMVETIYGKDRSVQGYEFSNIFTTQFHYELSRDNEKSRFFKLVTDLATVHFNKVNTLKAFSSKTPNNESKTSTFNLFQQIKDLIFNNKTCIKRNRFFIGKESPKNLFDSPEKMLNEYSSKKHQ